MIKNLTSSDFRARSESGNVVFFILIAIVLIGAVTVALRSGGDGANIDQETLLIRVSQVRQFSVELSRGVGSIMQRGASEQDISFAHDDATGYGDPDGHEPRHLVFHPQGGDVEYRFPPRDISTTSQWEFYGNLRLPEVGTPSRAELVAVLPDVTLPFCRRINEINGYSVGATPPIVDACNDIDQPFDDGTFLDESMSGTQDLTTNATFTVRPPVQGCFYCDDLDSYYFFSVLMPR